MSNANKALLAGFVIGAVILGAVGLLLAPQLLAIAGVGLAVPVTQAFGVSTIFSATSSVLSAGVTAAAFGQLQAGIAVFMGLIGGLAGGLIGVKTSKMENNPTLQNTPLSSVAPINNEKVNGYSPSLDVDGQDTAKSYVKRYEQEKSAKAAASSVPSP